MNGLLKKIRFVWKLSKRIKVLEKENADLWEKLNKHEKDTQDQIRLLAVKIDNLTNTIQQERPIPKKNKYHRAY